MGRAAALVIAMTGASACTPLVLPPDAGTPDADGLPDAACVRSDEVCNGRDDDCDGAVDEGDAQACAPDPEHAVSACEGGRCVVRCDPGYADCGGADDGCETPLGTPSDCEACGDACGWSCGDGGCVDVERVSAGASTTCAIVTGGRLWCWGGGVTEPAEIPLPGDVPVTDVAHGVRHLCALAGGDVYCWGDGEDGQLGIEAELVDVPQLVLQSDGRDVIAIAAGAAHTCISDGAEVACWGANDAFQCGHEGAGGAVANVVPDLALGVIAAGAAFSCAGGATEIACWGSAGQSQLGAWRGGDTAAPQSVRGGRALAMGAGRAHACALVGTRAFCWGGGARGELGTGGSADDGRADTPVGVVPSGALEAATPLGVGLHHACARRQGSTTLYCWGANGVGQAGVAGGADQLKAAPVEGVEVAVESSLGLGSQHTCAVDRDRRAWCWGSNAMGQLGVPGAGGPTPVRVLP